MPKASISDVEKAELIKMYDAGAKVREITARFGICKSTMRKIVAKSGTVIRKNKSKLSNEEKAELIKIYEGGMEVKELMEKYDISQCLVLRILNKNNVIVRRGLTEEEKNEMAELYQNGTKTRQLMEKFGISKVSVLRNLRKKGVEIRPDNGKLDNEKRDDIVKAYQGGEKISVLAEKHDVYHSSIAELLKRRDVKLRPDNLTSGKKYEIDETFFNEINDEASSYILGMLFGDGYNSTFKGAITLSLKADDKEVLEKINILLKSDKPLVYGKDKEYADDDPRGKCYKLIIYNRHISKKLEEFGCVQAKTFLI